MKTRKCTAMVGILVAFAFIACDDGTNPKTTHTHNWGNWEETAPPTITEDGMETRVCTLDSTHIETRTAYATGTLGLAFELIAGGSNANTYRVRKGTVTIGTVHIPAYYRPNANSGYLSVTEIGSSSDTGWSNYAFYNTDITAVIIPASITVVGSGAFLNCTKLASVTIPASVSSIGSGAFVNCTSLNGIMVDTDNPNYASDDGILYNKAKTTLIATPGAITSLTIPASVTSIGSGAFQGHTCLTAITIPVGVTSIGSYAFYDWTASQTIIVQGHSNEVLADTAWGTNWRSGCNAIINYHG